MMNFNPEKYGILLATTLPASIENEAEYARVIEIINRLMSKDESKVSPEEEKLLDLLADLVENYERKIYPALEATASHQTLNFLIAENGLSEKDLLEFFDSPEKISAVRSGKTGISRIEAEKLATRFKVSPDLFL